MHVSTLQRVMRVSYHGKAISITYAECVSVALVIQHAKRICHIILSSVICLAVIVFFHVIL